MILGSYYAVPEKNENISMKQGNSTIIQSIVEQHAEEVSFLWLLRDSAIHAGI